MSSLVACTRTRGFKVRDLEVVRRAAAELYNDATGKEFLASVLHLNSLYVHGAVFVELEEYGGGRSSHRAAEAHPWA